MTTIIKKAPKRQIIKIFVNICTYIYVLNIMYNLLSTNLKKSK